MKSQELTDAVQELITSAMAPGATIAVSIDGETTSAGVGYRDLDHRTPLPIDARFYLYSITKTLLATATLRLVEQGVVDLETPIQDVLPDLPIAVPITLRQLLIHTGGLPDYGGMTAYQADLKANPATPWTTDEFLNRTLQRGLLFPPGEGWEYSNIGYMLVRLAIEQLTGQSLRNALASLVFDPLGMSELSVAESLADTDVLTPGYSTELDDDGQLHDITRCYHPGWVSHGVVIADAANTARLFDAIIAGDQLLAPESRAAMLQSVRVPGDFPPFGAPGYGLGVMTDLASRYGQVAGHAGGGPGYATAAFHFPNVAGHRVTSVALINHDRANAAVPIVFALVDLVAQQMTG